VVGESNCPEFLIALTDRIIKTDALSAIRRINDSIFGVVHDIVLYNVLFAVSLVASAFVLLDHQSHLIATRSDVVFED